MKKGMVAFLMILLLCVVVHAASKRVIGRIELGDGRVAMAYDEGECLVWDQDFARMTRCPIPYIPSQKASDVYTLTEAGKIPNYEAHANGSLLPPEPWDHVVWKGGEWGHIAVIKDVDLAAYRLLVVEQNWPGRQGEVWLDLIWSGKGWELASRGSYTPLGWVHPKKGMRPQLYNHVVRAETTLGQGDTVTYGHYWKANAYATVRLQPSQAHATIRNPSTHMIVGQGSDAFSFTLPETAYYEIDIKASQSWRGTVDIVEKAEKTTAIRVDRVRQIGRPCSFLLFMPWRRFGTTDFQIGTGTSPVVNIDLQNELHDSGGAVISGSFVPPRAGDYEVYSGPEGSPPISVFVHVE